MLLADIPRVLEDATSISGIVLTGILLFIGARVVASDRRLEQAGKRIGLVGFFGSFAILWHSWTPSSAEDFLGILFRSLVAWGLTLGVAWISLPTIAFVYSHSIGAVVESLSSWSKDAADRRRQRHERAKAAREERRRRLEWDRSAPERERLRLEREEQGRLAAIAQKRRDDARAAVQLLYARHAPEIGTRFPREEFDAFIEEYMHDKRTAEYVEERAEQLRDVILEHKKCVNPPKGLSSASEVLAWYEEQRKEIEALPEGRTRRSLMSNLEERYAELIEQLLEQA